MLKNLNEIFQDTSSRMSTFQDDYFVTIKSGKTLYGQYKQSSRELKTRFDNIVNFLYGENNIRNLNEEVNSLKQKNINSDEYKYKSYLLDQQTLKLKEMYVEFIRFWQQASLLKEKIGELTPEKKHQFEKEMWHYKIKELIVMDLIQNSGIKSNTIEIILSLPTEERKFFIDIVKNRNKQEELVFEILNKEYETVGFEQLELPENISLKEIEDFTNKNIKLLELLE